MIGWVKEEVFGVNEVKVKGEVKARERLCYIESEVNNRGQNTKVKLVYPID
mgnify:CR=1 FL=1